MQCRHVHLSKNDVADGFYQIWVKANGIPKLTVLFPTEQDEQVLVGLPLTLPMGWKESPPYFSTTTETAANLANATHDQNRPTTKHRLDPVSETPPPIDEQDTPCDTNRSSTPSPCSTPHNPTTAPGPIQKATAALGRACR